MYDALAAINRANCRQWFKCCQAREIALHDLLGATEAECVVNANSVPSAFGVEFAPGSHRFYQGVTAILSQEPYLLGTSELRLLDQQRGRLSAAEAQRRNAALGPTFRHRVEQRDEDARAGHADRVGQRDRAAAHVHAITEESPRA